MRPQLFTQIASGDTLSATVDLTQVGGIRSIKVPPNITSGHLFLQGGSSTTSADFARVQRAYPNSGDITISVVGSVPAGTILGLPDEIRDVQFAPFFRIEASNAQIDTRSFTLFAARW